MRNNLILKSQADQIFLIISQFKMSPDEFSWAETKSGMSKELIVSKLLHSKSEWYFRFDLHNGEHYCAFSPGETKQVETQFPGSWELQINYFKNWLSYLKREITSPNLWGQIEKGNLLAKGVIEYDDNLPFTSSESQKILVSLNELKAYVLKTHSLPPDEISFLETRISYLEESSTRLGRKDWVTILIGVLANIIIGLALAPQTAKELFSITSEAFNWLLINSFVLPK